MLTIPSPYERFASDLAKAARLYKVAEHLLASLNRATGAGLHSLLADMVDPGSLSCADADGNPVALDVIELERIVGDAGCARAEMGRTITQALTAADLKPHPVLHGARRAVCMLLDTPPATIEAASQALGHASFGPFRTITDAFLLFPYDAGQQRHPVIAVTVRAPRL